MEAEYREESRALLEHKAYNLRRLSIMQTSQAGSGHVTSCLSCADIVAVLFFYSMRYNLRNFDDPNNDRFILSKGHAAPVLYAAWKEAGVLTENHLMGYRSIKSTLEGHPTFRFAYAEAATGSLGIGLSIGVGEALCAKVDKRSNITYVLMGDSEIAEGSVWEAASLAAYYRLNNLIGIVDCNRLGQSTETMIGCAGQRYADMFASFGFITFVVDGHDVSALMEVFDDARLALAGNKPVMIIAKTHKGHGIEYVEDKEGFHGQAFKKDAVDAILAQLKARFLDAALYKGDTWVQHKVGYHNLSCGPKRSNVSLGEVQSCGCKELEVEPGDALLLHAKQPIKLPACSYEKDTLIATRKVYGQALALLGDVSTSVVSLDAEVKNSTYAEIFEHKHPERFIQCFVAEQNMVGMGIGFSKRGKIPFISTFGCFFSRAYDQIRMAVLSNVALRLVGSHVGVSIGQDGPSQMALEDIGMMRALPHSVVVYPSDAVSAYKLVEQMALYKSGISYMRTTRGETPVLYDNDEQFPLGGCKILRQSDSDSVCIIAAGITLHEALKAYDALVTLEDPVHVSIIDLYSIKPLDIVTIVTVARSAGNKIITVEDHYKEGGIGEVVASAVCNAGITVTALAVNELPRSGLPQELLAWAKIDSKAIIESVLRFLNR